MPQLTTINVRGLQEQKLNANGIFATLSAISAQCETTV